MMPPGGTESGQRDGIPPLGHNFASSLIFPSAPTDPASVGTCVGVVKLTFVVSLTLFLYGGRIARVSQLNYRRKFTSKGKFK